jgi:hypothetical protein
MSGYRGGKGRDNASAQIPHAWIGDILDQRLDGPVGVLTQASALLTAMWDAETEAAVQNVRERYRPRLRTIVERLVVAGVQPPTPLSVESLIILGGMGSYAFPDVRDVLERALRHGPLGFRVWRALTAIVHATASSRPPRPSDEFAAWLQRQLADSLTLRQNSLYPARSLDLELAIAVPPSWMKGGADWADEVLRERMAGRSFTPRERGTAASGLWQRALSRGPTSVASARRELHDAVAAFRVDAAQSRGGAELRWIADTLEHLVDQGMEVGNAWPPSHERCLKVVQDIARAVTVPDIIRESTATLFEHALLQNAGVYRRRAIDALRVGGWAGEVARALGEVLRHDDAEPWLRCRVLFALGLLQERGETVQLTLRQAYDRARRQLEAGTSTQDAVAELHATVFAIGDCFGLRGAQSEAKAMWTAVSPSLRVLATQSKAELVPVARAAAYTAAVTEQAQDRLLRNLADHHSDGVTRRVATWGLERVLPRPDARTRG